jgi:ubiquinone/menaquinone biosynthesis C-methylase UbiE
VAVDLDTYRQESLDSWGQMAPGWEARRDWLVEETSSVFSWLVHRAGPQQGATFLDLAAGTGDLGFRLAERVGEDGKVISTDFAPEMVDVARRLSEERGLRNVEHRVLDAERMDLADDSVDGVVCRFGYMLMADPAVALGETRRVLRPGGPLAFAVWTTPDRNPWAAIPGMTVVQRGHMPPPEPARPGIFAMGDSDRIHALVTGAGFGNPEVEEIEFEFHYADFEDFWDSVVRMAGPLARVLSELTREEREATKAAIMGNMAPFRNEDGSYTAPAVAWGVLTR